MAKATWGSCEGCGGHIRSDNKTGRCTRNPHCRSRKAREWNQDHPGYHRDVVSASRTADPVRETFKQTRSRARRQEIPFEITPEDIRAVWRDTCPVFGVPLARSIGVVSPCSPSLDKIEPAKGYVPGNIQILSFKANAMKNDATREELVQFARWVLDTEGIAHD